MSANRRVSLEAPTRIAHADPIYFASADRTLFAWLHSPSKPVAASLGLVICNPFGYEATCAHRSIRAFAEGAANLSIPALRFDYSGTGDSTDLEPGADQIAAWCDDIVSAVTELQRLTGVKQVCLLGIRLGAMLACVASRRCNSVQALALIAPTITGIRYVSQLRTIALAASLKPRSARPPNDPNSVETGALEIAMELSGFALSHATIASLSTLDISVFGATDVRNILVIDNHRAPMLHDWIRQFAPLGVEVTHLPLPGLIEMTMTPPLLAKVPQAMVSALCSWLPALRQDSSQCPHDGPFQIEASPKVRRSTTIRWPEGQGAHVEVLTERPVLIDSDITLFGIVTAPSATPEPRGVVILLNTGADYHVGPNRMYVSLARRWARDGFVVLRLDLAGLGDSNTRPESKDDEVFPSAALEDIAQAIEFMRRTHENLEVTLMGVCSGGYHALRAAVAGLPIHRIVVVNPENYFWSPQESLEGVQLSEVVRSPVSYREQFRSYHAWKLLLTGKVDLWRMLTIYLRRLALQAEWTYRFLARKMHITLARNLGSELEQMTARSIRTVFVFAKGEPGVQLLKLQTGFSWKRLEDHVKLHLIDGGDHIFSQREPRAVLEKVLTDELLTRPSNKIH